MAAGPSASPVVGVIGFVLIGGAIVAGATLNIVRALRARKPREKQMMRLAAQLDGRNQVFIRTIEIGLSREDLLRVAYSRGYSLIDHRFGRYYEFVYTPHQPGRWA
jgi:hypothetical protein